MAKRTCKLDGCERERRALGYCLLHYRRFKEGRDLEAPVFARQPRLCSVDGCDRQAQAKGFCGPHYKRHRKGSDMSKPIKGTVLTCTAPNCNRPVLASGYCNAHYLRARNGSDMSAPVRMGPKDGKCTVPGCGRKHMGRGFCANHYRAWQYKRFWRHIIAERGGRCEACGKHYPMAVFDMHHRDPSQKKFSLSSAPANRSWEAMLEEAAKCDLLCANCHRILHFTNREEPLFPL